MRSNSLIRKKGPARNTVGMMSALIMLGIVAAPARGQTTLYTVFGDSANDQFGRSVSDAGDVDGDGFADFIVGAPFDDSNGANSGSARVFSGADGSILYTFNGDSQTDQFGYSVSGAGDVNNDGVPDFIVGARFDDNNCNASGSARVFSGIDGSILYTFNGDSPIDQFGWSVSGTGDVNDDGHADVIVGAPFDVVDGPNSGSARVFSGFDGSVLYTLDGDSTEGDRYGFSVSDAGDVNDDGFADFIVGAPSDDNPDPPDPGGGRGDFTTNTGSARVYSGIDGSVLYTVYGHIAWASLGESVNNAGDVDGDGRDDFITGAPGSVPVTFTGRAWVFSGSSGTVLYTFDGGVNYAISVSGAGDVDGDGFADLIVGEKFFRNDMGVEVGKADVFSGFDGSTLFTFVGEKFLDLLGFSVSGAGDVNDDGFADFIIGIPVHTAVDDKRPGSAIVISPLADPVVLLDDLLLDVLDLDLPQGTENSLSAKLDAVMNALNNLDDQVAINVLQSFINAVQAQSGKNIPVVDADALIAAAQAIINQLLLGA